MILYGNIFIIIPIVRLLIILAFYITASRVYFSFNKRPRADHFFEESLISFFRAIKLVLKTSSKAKNICLASIFLVKNG